jgi:hypothetical protein
VSVLSIWRKLKKEETYALNMAESDGHQSDATTRLTPAGVTAAFTPNEQMSTGTLTSTKKKADPPLPGPFPITPRQGPPYDYAWYHSPLEEPSIYHMSNPAAAVTAYEATKAVNERV